ncbi:MAG: TetR/AcrR family transcriptional regulator [Kordiimonas sp.]
MSEQGKIEAVKQPSVGRGRPRDNEKNAAIVEAAAHLFLDKGFDGTSMDEVAKGAGVSKQTVYSHFSSKEQLFSASIRAVIERYYPETVLDRVEEHSLEADLRVVCESYAHLLMSKEAMAMFRLLVAAAPKGPMLANLFWNAGPREMQDRLEAFLLSRVQKGELDIPDIEVASSQIVCLLKAKSHFMHSIGLIDSISEEQIQKNVDNAVDVFLKLYRV